MTSPVLTKKGRKAKQVLNPDSAVVSGLEFTGHHIAKLGNRGLCNTDLPITSSQMGFLWAALNGRYDLAKTYLRMVDDYMSFKTTPSDRWEWLKKCLVS
jgi:hypothetical protein